MVARFPEGVAGPFVIDPVAEIRHLPPDSHLVGRAQRQVPHRRREELRRARPGAEHMKEGPLLIRHHEHPREGRVEPEGLAGEHRSSELREAHVDRERPQIRPRLRGDGPLGVAQVTGPHHRELAVEPGLFTEPLHRGEPVLALVVEGVEHPAGAERPAATLHHHLKPALREGPPVDQAPQPLAAVRRPHQDGGQSVRVPRRVPVREEHHPVRHPGRQIAVNLDSVRLRRRQAVIPPEDSAENAHRRTLFLRRGPEPRR